MLEEVRLLTNLETAKQKLLQIILIGQPELRDLLARNDLRQLAQRITGRYHLEPLSREETAQYIEHRLQVAGALGEVFDVGAKQEAYRHSQGVPRLINVICDRALLGAYSNEQRRVDRRTVRRAAAEITGKPRTAAWPRWIMPAFGMAAAAVIAAGLWLLNSERSAPPQETSPAPAVAITAEPQPSPVVEEPEPAGETDAAEETLDEQLQVAADLTSTESALATLLELWGLEYQPGRAGCTQAAAVGYECLFQRGSWAGLRQYDRPAVLTLLDSTGATHNVVLTAIEGEFVDLSLGGVTVSHPVASLTELWFGQYLLLWRPPNGTSTALKPGSQGPDVVWLRDSLAAIDERYRTTPANAELFDNELREQVMAFQRDHRLNVDGLAGRQTQIFINTLLAPDNMPRLTIPRLAQE